MKAKYTKSFLKMGVFILALSLFSFTPVNSYSQQKAYSLDEILTQASTLDGCSMNYIPVVNSYLISNGYSVISIQMPDCDNAFAHTVKNSIHYTTHVYLTNGIVTEHEDELL